MLREFLWETHDTPGISVFRNEFDFQRGSTFVTRRIDPFAWPFVCLMIRIDVISTSKFVHGNLVASIHCLQIESYATFIARFKFFFCKRIIQETMEKFILKKKTNKWINKVYVKLILRIKIHRISIYRKSLNRRLKNYRDKSILSDSNKNKISLNIFLFTIGILIIRDTSNLPRENIGTHQRFTEEFPLTSGVPSPRRCSF